jgi:hypothetical protein
MVVKPILRGVITLEGVKRATPNDQKAAQALNDGLAQRPNLGRMAGQKTSTFGDVRTRLLERGEIRQDGDLYYAVTGAHQQLAA